MVERGQKDSPCLLERPLYYLFLFRFPPLFRDTKDYFVGKFLILCEKRISQEITQSCGKQVRGPKIKKVLPWVRISSRMDLEYR